ncbi:hypothetical protein ACFOY8_14120 [Thalassospira xianhensis]|uniref:Sucrose phosphatase-like domain-containing protein n=1 Tax=Thalassospira xianhensis MCCC 1A02616 TaxID=1177929 RepID=A0A367UHC6_9PROT|nr:hypothetical protein [Thalassospira xianhensis]RCK07706.1 hypothetical protein TH5_01145 [Thalassospira xianhensis MCCC 1A02616]
MPIKSNGSEAAAVRRQTYSFVDLDDCLFNSKRKLSEKGGVTSDHQPASVDRTGEHHSFRSPAQMDVLAALQAIGKVIVVTGRSMSALQRVTTTLNAEYSIGSFGGFILDEQCRFIEDWSARTEAEASKYKEHLDVLVDDLKRVATAGHYDLKVQVIWDIGQPLYICVRHNSYDTVELADFARRFKWMLPRNWHLYLNDNNLGFLPPYLGKDKAVSWLWEHKLRDVGLTLGMGDSLSDLKFIGLCDFAIFPTSHSQNFSKIQEYHQ